MSLAAASTPSEPSTSASRAPRSAAPGEPRTLRELAEIAGRALDLPLVLVSPAAGGAPHAWARSPEAWRARREAALPRTLCRIPARTGRALALEDAREHPAVREDPAVWLGEVAYAGVPVIGRGGAVMAVLAAVDARPRAWSEDELRLLERLAGFAAGALEARRAAGTRPAHRGRARKIRRVSAWMLEKAVETMQLGVTITDTDGRIVFTNAAEARMHGYSVEELLGKHARIFAPAERSRPLDAGEMPGLSSWSRETTNLRRDGSVFPVVLRSDVVSDPATGEPLGIVTCCEDVSERREMERQLLQSAFYDALTGLPNRVLLSTRLDLAIDQERRGGGAFALLVVGLDGFKRVNDSLGHAAGDELLAGVGGRLREHLGPRTLVAHLAGDEFAVLLEELHGPGAATRAAERVRAALAPPFRTGGHDVFTGAGIGIALSQTGYERPDDVVRDATLAMYRAKAAGAGRWEVFDREMHARAVARLHLETDLRRALERGELRVHYQPIVSLATGRVAGLEALARWQHPAQGLLQPDAFIPLAEETGLILPLGMWVLEEACRRLARLQEGGRVPGLTMAVNLSPRQFAQADLVEQVAAVLERTGIRPGSLKLEITESVIMQHSESVTETLHRLKALGIQLYIDDFGTGYSSLAYLHRLPLDALKIDRAFVCGADGPANLPLVRAIVAMAHALNVKVVTEGIESAEVLAALRSLRCEYGQGYLFSRPLDDEAVERLCDDDPRW